MSEPHIKWAERKLGRKLHSHDGGFSYRISEAELDKLTRGPNPLWFVIPALAGLGVAQLIMWAIKAIS